MRLMNSPRGRTDSASDILHAPAPHPGGGEGHGVTCTSESSSPYCLYLTCSLKLKVVLQVEGLSTFCITTEMFAESLLKGCIKNDHISTHPSLVPSLLTRRAPLSITAAQKREPGTLCTRMCEILLEIE